MLSVLSVDEVEKRIGEVPGVESVTVNYAAGNATVRFDETHVEIADIKSAVRQRGFEPAAPADGSPGAAHEGHAAAGAAPPDNTASPAKPDPAPAEPPAAPDAAVGDDPKDKAAPEKS